MFIQMLHNRENSVMTHELFFYFLISHDCQIINCNNIMFDETTLIRNIWLMRARPQQKKNSSIFFPPILVTK